MKFRTACSLAIGTVCLMVLASGAPVSAGIAQPKVVSANPADFTPQIPLGSYAVHALRQVGGTMYAGGTFTSLGGKSRSRIGAFSATTGAMTTFAPTFNDAVWAIVDLGGKRLAVGGSSPV